MYNDKMQTAYVGSLVTILILHVIIIILKSHKTLDTDWDVFVLREVWWSDPHRTGQVGRGNLEKRRKVWFCAALSAQQQSTSNLNAQKTQTICNKITADRSSLEIFVRCSLKFREDRGTEIAFDMKTSIVLSYSIKVSCFINIDTVTVLYFRSPWYGKCTTSPRHCDPYKDISHNVYNEGSIDKLLFEGANSSLYPD